MFHGKLTGDFMILSVTFSKPVKNISEILDDEYTRIKIKRSASSKALSSGEVYFAEFYTEKQVFHKKMSQLALDKFIDEHAGKTFKNCVERTETQEITILSNKKGNITRLVRNIPGTAPATDVLGSASKKKNYILEEGKPVPFLVLLGIMTENGKVVASKYDKFRQINRFLEFVDDICGEIQKQKKEFGEDERLNVVDFGSGKSYLTFALHYFFTEVKNIPCEVFGLDLKKDVIDYCSSLAEKLSLKNISFAVGDISSFGEEKKPDLIVTLHACDTATDFALDYAVTHGAKAILSVPCCQHELNANTSKSTLDENSSLKPLFKYGLIKERFCALVTDAVRAELLEGSGYKVQILEFIDDSGTPKNVLIRAVKSSVQKEESKNEAEKLLGEIGSTQKLMELFNKN